MNCKHITWKGYILPQKAHNLRMLTKTKDQNTAQFTLELHRSFLCSQTNLTDMKLK